jgi:8-oxo-dGTP pyrophosphatase MutT (NUDIX family)
MLKPWEPIESSYLHQESWFKLRADRLRKGNGQEMNPYYVLEYSDWVNVFPLTTDNKVVLVRQYRYALQTFSIEVPGGIMDSHENHPEEAAKRELLEETGFTCGHIEKVAVVATNPATQNNRLHCFLATDCQLTHPTDHDENEEIEVLLASLDELLDLIKTNQIVQSLHLSTMLYALMKLDRIVLK